MYINLKRYAALLLSITGLFVYAPDSQAQPLIQKTFNNQLDLSNNPLSSSSALSSLLDSGNTTPGLAQKPKTAIDRLNSTSPRYAQSPEPNSPPPDKSQYNLFNPTPRKLWRNFSTDRPHKTETPFTVDAGRFTMEADLFIYTKNIDRPNNTTTESYNYFVPNFKVGLTNFELYTNTGTGKGFAATFDTGLKYLLTENVQLDAGVNIGLTEAADAFQPFLGMSVRF